jgi:TetR/AcrR family fatty acid metabolism transcriptional regulator
MTLVSRPVNERSGSPRRKTDVVQEFRVGTIMEAALHVVSRKGLAGATMQEIAAEAGIAKGTIYLYFKSREELVERTARWAIEALRARLRPIFEAEGEPFAERLRALVETKIAFFHEHRQFFRIYLSVFASDSEVRRRKSTHYDEHLATLSGLLARAMKKGEIAAGDSDRLAFFVAEGIHSVIVKRLSETHSPAPAQEAEWVVRLLVSGLQGKKRTA